MSEATLAALRAGRLAGARALRLSGLGLTAVPPEVFGLADTLEVLDLGDNPLHDLPDAFARLGALRVLFCSGTRMTRLPPVLGACPALSQLGFRGCGLREIPAEALPPRLRWLTLTDNALAALPATLGERPALQKLMLAGNRLRHLPEKLGAAPRLELIRLAANDFEALPPWLAAMPRLAWLAFADNPLDVGRAAPAPRRIPWDALRIGAAIGEGASGVVQAARWDDGSGDTRDVAIKRFKGAMTSDGLPEREMAACLAAGAHADVLGAIGRATGHPEGADVLVLPLLPPHWRALAAPPSLESCSRDVFEPAARFRGDVALRIAAAIARAGAHLHGRGLLHGDLYAHNVLWDGAHGQAVLSDFGAAGFMPVNPPLAPLDVLAFGVLLGELLERCDETGDTGTARAVAAACLALDPATRPTMADVAAALPSPR